MGWDVVTGGGGFIGSNLVRSLLTDGHRVRVVDNFATGRRENLLELPHHDPDTFQLIEMDISDSSRICQAFEDVDVVYHQAALPSVPFSVDYPQECHRHNLTGTLNVLLAARECHARRVVFASSSAVYGDAPALPKTEDMPVHPQSPYAVAKIAGEQYCRLFTELYGLDCVVLRYFNVFGPRQNPNSQYAAVIPNFIQKMLNGRSPVIFGDGQQTRDFCYVDDVVTANRLAASAPKAAWGGVYNIARAERVDLLQLAEFLYKIIGQRIPLVFEPATPGDVRHSVADISAATRDLGYVPNVSIQAGLERTVAWYQSIDFNMG